MSTQRSRSSKPRKQVSAESRLRTRITWAAGGVLVFIFLQIFVFQDEGLYRLFQLRGEIEELEQRIATLEAQNEELSMERDRLLNDPEYLERIARERFRMAKPGEKVFHVTIERKSDTDP